LAPSPDIKGKAVLVTGATGSFGNAFIRRVLADHEPASLRVYSRDELKQLDMQQRFEGDDRLRFLIGDVRDLGRLKRAMHGIDLVIHAAALKQVPAAEYNPFEAVQTNIVGAENVVTAAIENRVPKTLALSTDKAVNPVNLYGATKLCAEKIFTQGNAYAPDGPELAARFATARYGNVVGSRGSVIPLFQRQAAERELTITDESMTRFWITLAQAVEFVIGCVGRMQGGEVFVPKIPSMSVLDIAEALAPQASHRIIGIRPGEKIHETLLTSEEARHATCFDDHFVIHPSFPFWRSEEYPQGQELPPGFSYSSDLNEEWLTVDQIREIARQLAPVG
jgi:UDP-N-acetylglucosamine 4,6-dehydratase/5-epimerase